MQAWLVVACVAVLATLAVAQKPGRFLTLPNPQKCANSEYSNITFNLYINIDML